MPSEGDPKASRNELEDDFFWECEKPGAEPYSSEIWPFVCF